MGRMSHFITVAIFSLSVCANASEEVSANILKGNLNIAGDVTLGTASYSNSNSSSQFSITPSVGYFIIDKFSLGGLLGYTQSSTNTPSGGDKNTTSFSFGPAAKYYFWQQDKLATHIAGSFYINKYTPGDYSYWRVRINIGFEYFILPSVAIGPGFLYRHQFKTDNVPDMNEFVLFGGLAIFI